MDTPGNRVSHTYTMTIAADAATIFPLLCPVREFDWIDVWSCDVVYSESGVAELGCERLRHYLRTGEMLRSDHANH